MPCADCPPRLPQDRSILESDPELDSLDFSSLTPSPAPPHWDSAPSWTSKEGIFNPERVTERARWVRRWLRERSESKIVVVAHGDILRVITDGRRSATVRLSRPRVPFPRDARVWIERQTDGRFS